MTAQARRGYDQAISQTIDEMTARWRPLEAWQPSRPPKSPAKKPSWLNRLFAGLALTGHAAMEGVVLK